MRLVSSNEEITNLRRVVVTFKDGSTIAASNVTDIQHEDFILQIDQFGGDYFLVPADDNVKHVQVLIQEEEDEK